MTNMLSDDVIVLEDAFNKHATPELRAIHQRAHDDDRDFSITDQALKAALVRAYAAGQMAAAPYRTVWGEKAVTPKLAAALSKYEGWGFYPHPDKLGYLKLQIAPKFEPLVMKARQVGLSEAQRQRWEAVRHVFMNIDWGKPGSDKTSVAEMSYVDNNWLVDRILETSSPDDDLGMGTYDPHGMLADEPVPSKPADPPSVEDHGAKEAERKAMRANINKAMGWKD